MPLLNPSITSVSMVVKAAAVPITSPLSVSIAVSVFDRDFDVSSGRIYLCETHCEETFFHVFKVLLAYHEVAAYEDGNAFQSCFVALFAQSLAVDFAMTIH